MLTLLLLTFLSLVTGNPLASVLMKTTQLRGAVLRGLRNPDEAKPDPNNEGEKALLCEVFLAKKNEWPQFTVPEELIRAVSGVDDL